MLEGVAYSEFVGSEVQVVCEVPLDFDSSWNVGSDVAQLGYERVAAVYTAAWRVGCRHTACDVRLM